MRERKTPPISIRSRQRPRDLCTMRAARRRRRTQPHARDARTRFQHVRYTAHPTRYADICRTCLRCERRRVSISLSSRGLPFGRRSRVVPSVCRRLSVSGVGAGDNIVSTGFLLIRSEASATGAPYIEAGV